MQLKTILKSRGFSLIELMISMLIGLIILNGVIQLAINSKRSYLDNQAISQIQENARFAVDILSRELRVAGYVGCMPVSNGELDSSALLGKEDGLLIDSANEFSAVEIFDNVSTADVRLPEQIRGDVRAGTDVLIVRHTDAANEWMLEQDLASTSGVAIVATNKEVSVGSPIALVSQDCASANLTQVSEYSGGTLKVAGAAGIYSVSGFKKGSRLSPVETYAYYIGESNVLDDLPALKRERLIVNGGEISSRSEELAVGVYDLQLKVGRVAAGIISFSEFDGVAKDAMAVETTLTLQSHKRLNPSENDDGFVRKTAVATVRIRNQG